MNTRVLRGLLVPASVAGLLAACAPPLKDPWGLAVLREEETAPSRPAPATVQADLGVSPHGRGAFPFSARLYAEPGARFVHGTAATEPDTAEAPRYRLDAFGFASTVAATWLWERNAWVLIRHDERTVTHGRGASIDAPGIPIGFPDVHAVLGFLWGAPLPGYRADSAHVGEDGVVHWMRDGVAWEARFDPATGLCREVRSPDLVISYRKHRLRQGLVIPGEAEVRAGGDPLLTLVVRDWVASPPWKKDPFTLAVPAGYHALP